MSYELTTEQKIGRGCGWVLLWLIVFFAVYGAGAFAIRLF